MRWLLPRNYLFTILGIAVGVGGLVALGAMAERITRFIDGGDRFVLGQISVAGEGMGMGTGFTAGGLLRAAKIAEIARVPGVAAVQPQVMLPLNPTTSQFLTLTQELILGMDPGVRMPNREFRDLPVRDGRPLRAGDRGVAVVGAAASGGSPAECWPWPGSAPGRGPLSVSSSRGPSRRRPCRPRRWPTSASTSTPATGRRSTRSAR